jgi:ribosomal protein S18 acetylase RimI-like enzyme
MMSPGNDEPIRLQESQIGQAGEALSKAFFDDPDFKQLVPDDSRRVKTLTDFFRVMLCYGVRYGEVYAASGEMESVAIWLPSEYVEMSIWALLRCGGLSLLFSISWKVLWQMNLEQACAIKLHKKLAPFRHWYLAVLGVCPQFQGKGYASRVVKPMLDRLDAQKLPGYVETSIPEYVGIYQHFGFEVLKETALPGSHSKMWAMLRKPAV